MANPPPIRVRDIVFSTAPNHEFRVELYLNDPLKVKKSVEAHQIQNSGDETAPDPGPYPQQTHTGPVGLYSRKHI